MDALLIAILLGIEGTAPGLVRRSRMSQEASERSGARQERGAAGRIFNAGYVGDFDPRFVGGSDGGSGVRSDGPSMRMVMQRC